jgi:lipid-A-disaccharide synthase
MPGQIFFSVGEPSGDIHASNLIRSLRQTDPAIEAIGFGGPRMEQAGCQLIYPLVDHPVMGLRGAIAAIPRLRGMLARLDQSFAQAPPAAIVLVDYPGFNWHVAKLGKKHGIPVIYYVPPQIWAWASHRVQRMKRYVDHILCSLPFEEAWYQTRGVSNAIYVGHPFFDDLALSPVDQTFVDQMKSTRGAGRVALLPGSRHSEVEKNGRLLVQTAKILRKQVPGIALAVAAFNEKGQKRIREIAQQEGSPLEVYVGKTRELLASADAAVSVSGSVSLELLYFQVPSAIIYNINWFYERVIMPRVLHSPYITLVNLLAGQQIYPEFIGNHDYSIPIARQITDWLTDPAARQAVRRKLATLKGEYGDPGASTFAANYILHDVLGQRSLRSRAA